MPNWVKNRIVIKNQNAEEIINRHTVVNEDGNRDFDFNTILKLPDELMIEKGSRSADGLPLYIAKINPLISNLGTSDDKLSLNEFLALMTDTFGENAIRNLTRLLYKEDDVDRLKSRYGNDFDDVVALGERVFQNQNKYGYTDWYDWSIANWGTKWNACSTDIDGNTVYFETAWSPPIPVIEKLSELYPDAEIEMDYAEEQTGIMSGHYVFRNGEGIEAEQYDDCSKEAYDLHFDLWGGKEYYIFSHEKNTYVYNEEIEME